MMAKGWIAVWGAARALDDFARRLVEEAPPLACVTAVESEPLTGAAPDALFRIAPSGAGQAGALIPPDAATCPACLAEVRDPARRRYGHAFANCTHCGPRLTIARAIPWDRAQTSMADFPLCPACAAEYEDPGDRRFHAQPIACPNCGPRLWLEGGDAAGDPVTQAARLLRQGAVVAVKGLGGFHLACDAGNRAAVAALRAGKAREAKPFALMATLEQARALCEVSEQAEALLTSPAAPIVLLPRRDGVALPDGLARGRTISASCCPPRPCTMPWPMLSTGRW
jgi:hydrogenase maturation protein HypF